jgi:transposase
MPRKLNLVRHLTRDDLEERYRKEKDSRLRERLQAILLLYEGKKTGDVASIVRRARSTIENWIGAWNERGIDGLVPDFTGGPKPRMASGEWDKIVKEIEGKGMTLRDVEVYVKDTRGVHYAYKTVWKALRKEKKVRYGKAYKMNAKRPGDAEGILKKS